MNPIPLLPVSANVIIECTSYLIPYPIGIISGIFFSLIKNSQVPVHLLPKFTFLKMMYSQNNKTGVFTGYRNQNFPCFPTMFKQTFK